MRTDKHAHPADGTTPAARPPATLLELLGVLARRPLLLAGSVLVGALVGIAAALQAPPSYEGSALVRIGQLPHAISVMDVPEPRSAYEALLMRLVETPALAAERMQTLSFVAAAGLPGAPEDQAGAIKVRAIRDSDLLELRYRAPSQQAVDQGLRRLVETLRQRHEELAQAGRARVQEELKLLQQLRAETANRRKEILQAMRPGADAPLLLMAMAVNDDAVRWEAGLRTALLPQLTRATALVEGPSVSRRRYDPARILRVLAGALAGVLLAAAVIVIQHVARRRRGQR